MITNARSPKPEARFGWDSYHECWFYGYIEYLLSVHNKDLKLELPLYLRLVQASRHDSVSSVISLTEAMQLYAVYLFESFHDDGAHDNYAMYHFFHKYNITAFIPLNETAKGNFKYPPPLHVDSDGVSICIAGQKTIYWGFNKDRCRIKYRCPLATGKITSCSMKDQCASTHGRYFT